MQRLTMFIFMGWLLPACQESRHEDASHGSKRNDVAAGQGIEEPDEGLNLSTLVELRYSIYLEFKKASVLQRTSNIKYPVCISTNFPTPLTELQREAKRLQLQRVANRWNAVLSDVKEWNVKSIELYTVGALNTPCDMTTNAGLKVYKVFGDDTRARGYAAYFEYLNVEGKDEFPSTDWRRNLHEMGHQFGLGDTYSEKGFQLPENQRPSMMNIYWNVSDLTQDDIDSAKHVWARISGKTSDVCPAGYVVGKAQENLLQNNFCVRKNPMPLYYNAYYKKVASWTGGTTQCLNLTGTNPGSAVNMAECQETTGQTWQATQNTGQKFRLESLVSGNARCLAVSPALNGSKVREYRIRIATCSSGAEQFWTVVLAQEKGFIQLKNEAYGRCLEFTDDAGFGRVLAMPCSAKKAQLWQFN